jgi:hypothetical protein
MFTFRSDQFPYGGQNPEPGGQIPAVLHDVAYFGRGSGRDSDDDLIDPLSAADLVDLLVSSQYP